MQIPRRTTATAIVWLVLPLIAILSMVAIIYSSNVTRVNAATCSSVTTPLPAWLLQAVNSNKTAYMQASELTGVPWELLAAIHYRETSFGRSNPGNGQGIFQFVNGSGGKDTPVPAGMIGWYRPGAVSDDEFTRQLTFMATQVQNDYVNRGSLNYVKRPLQKNETEIYRIKDTLFSYNGRSTQYANEASKYGYSPTNTPYEGSPYVMNMFDCKRASMGLITKDYGPVDGKDTRYGAFTLFARLRGDEYWKNLQTDRLPGCEEATNTALSCVWKLTDLSNGEQVFAPTVQTRNDMVVNGYFFESTAFFGINTIAPKPGNIPVYQLTKPNGASFLTTDGFEYSTLKKDWQDNGITFYADPAGSNSGYPVYRLYSASRNSHKWVQSSAEKASLLNNGYVVENIAFNSVSTVRQEVAPPSGKNLVYRFSNMPGNAHFWTTDLYERDSMITAGYTYEGVSWHSSAGTSAKPVYRLYAPSLRKHLWTTDAYEKSQLAKSGDWIDEGVSQYMSNSQTNNPIFRLYSPITKSHLWTKDAYEKYVLVQNGTFRDEGVAWYQPQ